MQPAPIRHSSLYNYTLPPGLEGQYTVDQIKLMCVAEAICSFSPVTFHLAFITWVQP